MADNPKNEACKTYLEQTKLLVTLTSAFIVAPAVFYERVNILNGWTIAMEFFFISSILMSYVVFGAIAGTQFINQYNVHRRAVKYGSIIQLALFFLGLICLLISLSSFSKATNPPVKQTASDSTATPSYKPNQVIRLNNVYFDFGKWNLRIESFNELDKLYQTLTKSQTMKIEIRAHTDSVGSDSYNLSLSDKRAGSVANYLLSRGISVSHVTYKGFGERMPVASNSTEEGRQINRRVEFLVINP
ncbi:MAG: OmpA family protein [Agriterribacter sp.]